MIETIKVPTSGITPEQTDISEFRGFDWKNDGHTQGALVADLLKTQAVLFARAKGFRETGMSTNEIALMYDLLEKKRPRVIVELGRNYGTSTRLFLQHVIRHGGIVESWDLKHWDGFIETMAENGYRFERFGDNGLYELSGVWLRIAHSIKTPVSAIIEEKGVDFLLIDTEHGIEHALGEYMRWREYLNAGALVAFHDSTLPAVARAIELVKEVEDRASGGTRIVREYVNESIDGFGIQVLEMA